MQVYRQNKASEHVFGLICSGIMVLIYQSKNLDESVFSRTFSPDIPHP